MVDKAIADNGNAANPLAAKTLLPILFDANGRFVGNLAGCGKHAGRNRHIFKELFGVRLNRQALHCGMTAREDWRNTNQRMPKRYRSVMDNFGGRNNNGFIKLGQIVALYLIEHFARVVDKRQHGATVQHIERNDGAEPVTLFQNVSVAMNQFGANPIHKKLDAGLVGVRFLQHGKEPGRHCVSVRVFGVDFLPSAVALALHQPRPHLGHVARNERQARIDAGECKNRLVIARP